MVSNKVSFGKKGFKYFMGYKDAKKIRPVCTLPPKMTAYRKDFDETKFMSFLIKVDIWEKVKDSLKIEFDSELVYKKKAKIPVMEKSTQISITIEYQKKVPNIFAF